MAQVVITPEEWTPDITGYYSIEIDSQLFELQSASQAYTISVPEADVIRFELHDGDQHWWDAENNNLSERAELADRATIAYGTPLDISYKFTLEPGEPNTAYFMVLGQLHQNIVAGAPTWGPPFNIGMSGERLTVYIAYTGADGNPVSLQLFKDVADIARGHEYDIDIKALFDPDGAGRLVVTIDGVTLIDYSGPLGYKGYDGVYWSEGIYRHSNATETVAATYGHLDIETGADVTFPSKNDFIEAPEVQIDSIGDPQGGNRLVALSGSAKAGTTVFISEGGVVIGSAAVDSQGHFSLDVLLEGSETHNLSAVSIDQTGRKGLTAHTMTFEIATAAEIVARMDEIVANEDLAAIILTDTHVLTVESGYQMRLFLKNTSVMDKIEGGFSFRTTTAISGQASYDRQDELYDDKGVLTERLRYQGDRLTYDEKVGPNNSATITIYKADGSWDYNVVENGQVVSYSQYNANDILVFKQTNFADGSKELDYFDATTGAMTASTLYLAAGGRVTTTYGITGHDYVEEIATFDSTGKLVSLDRETASGIVIFHRIWTSDGGMETHYYNASGVETSYSILHGDGSHVEATFLITGQTYAGRILTYSVDNVLTERQLLDASGHVLSIETFGANASVKIFAYDSSMTMTGYTLTYADHSHEVVTFYPGSETQVEQREIYDTQGNLIETIYYDPDGNVYDPNAPKTTTVYTYDQSGLAIGSTVTDADGSYIVTKFVAGHEELPIAANKYTADGRLYETNSFDSYGRLVKTELRNADGSREFHNFDPITAQETSYTIVYADKSRDEVNLAVTGKDYAQQFATYDSTGKLAEMIRKYGDTAHTVAFTQANHSDGSSEVHLYDTSGRETTAVVTAADQSRDTFSFTYIDTSATPSTVQQVHFAAGGVRQWVDLAKADGSHLQTSYADGVRLISHADVSDTLVGAATGNDTFIFHAGFGKDTISGFQAGSATPHDHIEFDTNIAANFDGLTVMMTQQGSDTVITVSANDVLVIKGVAPSALTAEDFSFV